MGLTEARAFAAFVLTASLAIAPAARAEDRFGLRVGAVSIDSSRDHVSLDHVSEWGGGLVLDWGEVLARFSTPDGSEVRFLLGLRAGMRQVGLASSGNLGLVFELETDGVGAAPELGLRGYLGPVLLEDRTTLQRGVLLGVELGIELGIGWRIDAATSLVWTFGLGVAFVDDDTLAVSGPLGIAYEGWF